MSADRHTIRRALPADVRTMATQRRAMFADLGGHGSQLAAVEARFPAWVAPRMADGSWRHWLAELANEPVGGAALWLREAPAGSGEHLDVVPTVLNVYVHPAHRRHGLARRLMEEIIAVCRTERLTPFIDLQASDMGRPLYVSMGVKPTAELRLMLE